MMWSRLCWLGLLAFGVFASGCVESDADARQEQNVEEPVLTPGHQRAALPSIGDTINCIEEATPPTLCEWAGAADTVVLGEILEVRLLTSPSVVADGSERLVDHCDGSVNPGLEIELAVTDVLAGEPVERLTFRVGFAQLDYWSPTLLTGPDGGVLWAGGDGLSPGQSLGAALHRGPDWEGWSLMGELLFTVDAQDTVHFQEVASICWEQPPEGAAMALVTDFVETVRSCSPSTAAEQRKARIEATWTASPDRYYAAVCIPSEESAQPECQLDGDCDVNHRCENARCVSS